MELQIRTWSPQQESIFRWFEKGTTAIFNDDYEKVISTDGHLVVRARAGTGKTTVVIEGVKRAPERSTLICAFSKDIATVLEARIGKNHPWIQAKTLHAVGFACVRRFRDGIKVSFNDDRAMDLTEKVCGPTAPDAIKRLVSKLHTKGREICPHARVLGDLTDLAIQFECEPEDNWANSGFPLSYVEQKALDAMELASQIKSGETIDGSDMIFLPVRNRWLTKQFMLVVVDEAQDMTPAQLEIALGVLKDGGRMAIVGDDRQGIFTFRGADSSSLDRLKDELRAAELGLTVTYRCGRAIVDLAAEIVPDFTAGENNPQGEVLYKPMAALYTDAGPGDFILSRVNAPLVSTAMKLLRAGKRTRIAGKDIGKGLVNLVRKFRATSVPDFLRKVEAWTNKETLRIQTQIEKAEEKRKRTFATKLEGILDQADMLVSLADGAKNVLEIQTRIEDLFTDNGAGVDGVITCSSVHRAKGLEANRVFVMKDTLRNYSLEEQNIEYVAITRAKQTLVFVSDKFYEEN